MLVSNCDVCGKKKPRFIKDQEDHYTISLLKFTLNKIVNKFSLAGDKSESELHLKHSRFTHSTCGRFTKRR